MQLSNGLLWRGIILGLMGLLCLFNPALSVATLVTILGVMALVAGGFILLSEYRRKQLTDTYSYRIMEGVFNVIVGVILVANPVGTATFLLVMLGILLLLMGILQLYGSSQQPKGHPAKALMFAGGLMTAILGILIISDPFGSAAAMIILIGIGLLISAGVTIWLAFRLRD